ncbi:hypothetical protein [Aurantivibrio infirmus]
MQLLKSSSISVLSALLFLIVATAIWERESVYFGLGVFLIVVFGGIGLICFHIFLWLPIHLMLKKINKNHIIWYIVMGFMPGIFVVYIGQPFVSNPYPARIIAAVVLGLAGVMSTVILWFQLVRKNA